MGFIHARNVCQKEVITFSWIWEEEEARLIKNMGSIEDQSYHHSKKIPQAMRNMNNSILDEPLIRIIIWIWNDDKAKWSRWSLPTKQIKYKYSIVISWYCFVIHLIIFSWCMWWVSSSWCSPLLPIKPLCWHIGLVHNLNNVMVEMEGI